MRTPFTALQTATLLAALRCYQQHLTSNGGLPGNFEDIATNGDEFEPMDEDAIDGLCNDIGEATDSREVELLSRAAGKLQEYCTEVNGDMNDALASEIEAYLDL